jgi:glycosyltransferase involved in cell wall biosynthesis
MAKVGIVTVMPNFFRHAEKAFKEAGHEVRTFEYTGDSVKDGWNLCDLDNWADIHFCELCQYPMDILTHVTEKPVVARLHRCEIYTPKFLNTIHWSKVDKLYLTNKNMYDKFMVLRKNKLMPKAMDLIQGPFIDLEEFPFKERVFEPPWRMAIVGNVIPRKRAYAAVQLLVDLPSDFTLTIAGNLKDKEYAEHIKDFCQAVGIGDRVRLLGGIPSEAIPRFMQDHHIILGMSREETAHYTIAEGMATGCYPVMNFWKNCKEIYPEGNIGLSPLEIIMILKKWEALPAEDKMTASLSMRKLASVYDPKRETEPLLKDIADLV